MRARQPGSVTTFADMLAESEGQAEQARRARRPLALRLLTWGQSGNPYLNALLKLEYLATLLLRFLLALIAAPFALHHRPMGAMVGFLALFGFWEIFDGFAKKPITDLYDLKTAEFQRAAFSADPGSTGNIINSRYKALKWLVRAPFSGFHGSPRTGGEVAGKATPQPPSGGTLGRLDKAVASLSETMDHRLKASMEDSPLISREEQDRIVAREMADLLRTVPSIEPDSAGIAGTPPPSTSPLIRFARPAPICHPDALFAPLSPQGPPAELYIAGRDGSDLKKKLRVFAARPLALGTPVRPLLNSIDEIVRPTDDLVLVSVKGEIGVVFEHDLTLPESPSR
jgi:hypothetical protein